MSDLARWWQIRPASPQLPVSWYFDAEIFALEKKLLFDAGANYVGHELMVPQAGDYHTLAWTNDAWMLVRNAQTIFCPLHRWTYDLKGELLGAPHFPESPCVKLRSKPLTSWNGLLFAGPRDPRPAPA